MKELISVRSGIETIILDENGKKVMTLPINYVTEISFRSPYMTIVSMNGVDGFEVYTGNRFYGNIPRGHNFHPLFKIVEGPFSTLFENNMNGERHEIRGKLTKYNNGDLCIIEINGKFTVYNMLTRKIIISTDSLNDIKIS